jgi:hypothetical protein
VEAAAVGFDDERPVPPEEVRLVALAVGRGQPDVHLGLRHRPLRAHPEEQALELATRPLRLRMDRVEDQPQPRHPTPPPTPLEQRPQLCLVEDLEDFRLPDRLPHPPLRFDPGEVKDRPSDGRARNPMPIGLIDRQERAVFVSRDPLRAPPPPIRRRHINRRLPRVNKPPQISGGPMRQHRPRPTSQHRRHEPPPLRHHRRRQRVHRLMNAM